MLETSRLVMRDYTAADIDMILPILSDPRTMSFWPVPFGREDVERWIGRSIASYQENGFGRRPIFLKESGELIGDCGMMLSMVDGELRNDIGYILHHPYWGRGYAIEASRAVMDDAFTRLGLDDIYANMPCDHDSSRQVAERLGMGRVREFTNTRNRDIRTYLYKIRRDAVEEGE